MFISAGYISSLPLCPGLWTKVVSCLLIDLCGRLAGFNRHSSLLLSVLEIWSDFHPVELGNLPIWVGVIFS